MSATLTSILKDTKITRVLNAVAAGQTEQQGTVLDMQDYDGVIFIALFNTVVDGAVLTLNAQEGALANGSDQATITGASAALNPTATNSNCVLAVDVYRPQKRYVRPDVTRTTQNVTIDGVIAIQYRGRVKPASVAGLAASAFVAGL